MWTAVCPPTQAPSWGRRGQAETCWTQPVPSNGMSSLLVGDPPQTASSRRAPPKGVVTGVRGLHWPANRRLVSSCIPAVCSMRVPRGSPGPRRHPWMVSEGGRQRGHRQPAPLGTHLPAPMLGMETPGAPAPSMSQFREKDKSCAACCPPSSASPLRQQHFGQHPCSSLRMSPVVRTGF